jgi:hypothetical protein
MRCKTQITTRLQTLTVQQITFLTWMMTFALTFLERPYSANLFSRNKLVNPFRQPTSQLSNNWRLVLLATLATPSSLTPNNPAFGSV